MLDQEIFALAGQAGSWTVSPLVAALIAVCTSELEQLLALIVAAWDFVAKPKIPKSRNKEKRMRNVLAEIFFIVKTLFTDCLLISICNY